MTITKNPPTVWLVDLDDTLYEIPEISNMVADKIRGYMLNKLGISQEDVEEKCSELYLNFGTTLAGLMASGYNIDFKDWHDEVHGTLPYEEYFKPDPKLKTLLDSIPVTKYIFTNADLKHAERCLDLLGLRSCFKGIICFESIMEAAEKNGLVHHNKPVICKPNRQAFQLALQQADDVQASSAIFFDDSTRNIGSAHRMGILSVLVGRVGVDVASTAQIRSMHDLPQHLPWAVDIKDSMNEKIRSLEAEELMEESQGRTALFVQA